MEDGGLGDFLPHVRRRAVPVKEISMKNKRLTIFDLDRTLVPFDSTELYPHVIPMLQDAADHGYVAIATNQGGPACKDAGLGSHYPTSDQVLDRIMAIVQDIEGIINQEVRCEICWLYKSPDGQLLLPNHVKMRDMKAWEQLRKPNPGLLLRLMAFYNVEPVDTVMIGDSDDDEAAALAAGITFIRVNFEPRREPETT